MDVVTKERFEKYLNISKEALKVAKIAPENVNLTDEIRKEFIDAVERYVSDAQHFATNGDLVTAFAALNYAHGWLDAGVKLGIFDVDNTDLFAGVG